MPAHPCAPAPPWAWTTWRAPAELCQGDSEAPSPQAVSRAGLEAEGDRLINPCHP